MAKEHEASGLRKESDMRLVAHEREREMMIDVIREMLTTELTVIEVKVGKPNLGGSVRKTSGRMTDVETKWQTIGRSSRKDCPDLSSPLGPTPLSPYRKWQKNKYFRQVQFIDKNQSYHQNTTNFQNSESIFS